MAIKDTDQTTRVNHKKTLTKKAKTIIWVSASCFVIAIIVGIILFFSLGDNTGIDEKKVSDIIAADVEKTFVSIVEEKKPFISEVLETASVSVLSITQTDEDTITAQCKVTSKNAYDAIKKTSDSYGEEKVTVNALLKTYSKELEKTVDREETLDITLKKENDEWKVDYSYELINALMGGYLEYNYQAMEMLESEGEQ